MIKLIPGKFYSTNGPAPGLFPSLGIKEHSIIMLIKIVGEYFDQTCIEIILNGFIQTGWVRNNFINNWTEITNMHSKIQNLISGKLYNIKFANKNSEHRVLPYWYLGECYNKFKQLKLPNILLYVGDIKSFTVDNEEKDSYTYQMKNVFINKNGALIKTQHWPDLEYEQIL